MPFRSNEVVNGKFEIDATDQDHEYSVYWTLKVEVATELLEYQVEGKEKRVSSPYTLEIDGLKKQVELDRNREIVFTI